MPISISGTGQGVLTAKRGDIGASAILGSDQSGLLDKWLAQEQTAADRRRAMIEARWQDLNTAPDGEVWSQDREYFDNVARGLLGKATKLQADGASIYDQFSPDYLKWQTEKEDASRLKQFSMQHKAYYEDAREAYDPAVHDPESMAALQEWAALPFEDRLKAGPPPALKRRGWEMTDQVFDPIVKDVNAAIATAYNEKDYETMNLHREEALRAIDRSYMDLILMGQDPDRAAMLRDQAMARIDRPLYDKTKEQTLAVRRWEASMRAKKMKSDEVAYTSRGIVLQGIVEGDNGMLGYVRTAKLGDRRIQDAQWGIGSSAKGEARYLDITLAPSEKGGSSENPLTIAQGMGAAPGSVEAVSPETVRIYLDDNMPLINAIVNNSAAAGKRLDYMDVVTQGSDEWLVGELPTLSELEELTVLGGRPLNSFNAYDISRRLNDQATPVETRREFAMDLARDLIEQGLSDEQAMQAMEELRTFSLFDLETK